MNTYSHRGLELLDKVSNLETVIERIDLASTKAATLMRATGMTLPHAAGDKVPGMPTLREVDTYLRKLVSEAYDSYAQAMASTTVATDVEGYASDDQLFDVSVFGETGNASHIQVTILMMLG